MTFYWLFTYSKAFRSWAFSQNAGVAPQYIPAKGDARRAEHYARADLQ